jgi:hypothetical protein
MAHRNGWQHVKLANVVLILIAWGAFPAAITGGPSQE